MVLPYNDPDYLDPGSGPIFQPPPSYPDQGGSTGGGAPTSPHNCPPPNILVPDGKGGRRCISPADAVQEDCPLGFHHESALDGKPCVPDVVAHTPGSGGGGPPPVPAPGGGGGGGGGAFVGPQFAVPGNTIEQTIWDHIQGILNGSEVPYTDAVLQRNKAGLFGASQGRAKADLRNLDYDLVQQGLYRAGARNRGRQEIRNRASGEYTAGVGQLLNQQAEQNFAARRAALDQAKGLLDSQRQFYLGMESNDVQKKVGMAQVSLGYARLAQEERLLDKQLAARGGGGGGDAGIMLGGVSVPPAVLNLLLGLVGQGGGQRG